MDARVVSVQDVKHNAVRFTAIVDSMHFVDAMFCVNEFYRHHSVSYIGAFDGQHWFEMNRRYSLPSDIV